MYVFRNSNRDNVESMLKRVKDKSVLLGAYSIFLYTAKNMTSLRVKVLNEILVTYQVVIYTRKNFHLLPVLDEVIQNLKSSGLINYWHEKSLDIKKEKHTAEPPQRLNFEKLSGSFIILAIGYSTSFVGFVFEWISFKLEKYCK